MKVLRKYICSPAFKGGAVVFSKENSKKKIFSVTFLHYLRLS